MGRLLLLGICLCVSTAAGQNIRLVDVFPFGPGEGDATVPSGNDAAVTVALDVPIMFYGELRQSITVGFIYIFGGWIKRLAHRNSCCIGLLYLWSGYIFVIVVWYLIRRQKLLTFVVCGIACRPEYPYVR